MAYTDAQLREFREEFVRRQRRVMLFIAGFMILFLLRLVLNNTALELPVLVWLIVFVFLLGSLASFVSHNWRCPACQAKLGHTLNQQRCANCGIDLLK